MNRRDFFKAVIGTALLAKLAPEVLPEVPAGTPLTEVFPDGFGAVPPGWLNADMCFIDPSTDLITAYAKRIGPHSLELLSGSPGPSDVVVDL